MENQNNFEKENDINSINYKNKQTGKQSGKQEQNSLQMPKPKKKKSAARELLEWVQAIAIAVVLALVVRSFVFNVVKVVGQSMEPTLQDGDRMIVWRLGYTPKAGDIVIFNSPGESEDTYWVKRVIATEGQSVKIDYDANDVYVDYNKDKVFEENEKIEEEYINDCECRDCEKVGGDDMRYWDTAITEITVPEGCVFVMGDNRNHSTDSRMVGCINEDKILGKAVVRFWPFHNMSTFKNPNDK